MKALPILLISLALAVPLGATETAAKKAESDDGPVTKTLVWPDGTRYVGGVVEGKRSGKGTIFWQDGTRFVGQFENDMRNGPGTMILPDGTVYTGFFRNDELIDTQSTITASNAVDSFNDDTAREMDDASTSSALGDTQLPMEADSIASEAPVAVAEAEISQEMPEPEAAPAEPEQTGITDVAESEASVTEEVETEALDEYSSEIAADTEHSLTDPYHSDVTEVTPEVEAQLTETIQLWAAAWQDQNVVQYLENYAEEFVVPGRLSRRNWEAQRRTSLKRPSFIKLDIEFQRFDLVEPNIVDVFFRQAYRSNTYSDLTDKVLRMKKAGPDWKTLIERSR
ncbi:MAG: hypothetical protein O3B72_09250 [Proteobacteria bacterium]|nr:hypothetical protein [Pseudomonadota bacterium]